MNYIEQLKKLGGVVADLVFPITCLVCGQDGTYLCQKCQSDLPRLKYQQCLVCQKPAPFGKSHQECGSRNSADGIISALSYKDTRVKKLIEVFKYKFISDLSDPLAVLMLEEISKQNLENYFNDFIIIPVPLHQRRQNWRGFNQAELLASKLSFGKIDTNLVNRIRFTKPQTKLSEQERKINISDAFATKQDLSGQKYLIVDDVVTTGSTINEIAKLLKKQKASEVWGLTVARG